jgi:hypothetical protein
MQWPQPHRLCCEHMQMKSCGCSAPFTLLTAVDYRPNVSLALAASNLATPVVHGRQALS